VKNFNSGKVMRKFFGSNKAFLAIIVGALIVGGVIYFGNSRDVPSSVAPTDLSEAKCLAPSQVLVTKVIDGDTIVVEGGYHIRLLGIDTDEKGYPCYEAAKSRLEELVLNKKVKLEKDKTDVDKYGRCLRYVFADGENIDLQLVKEGLAVARFYEPDVKYKNEIAKAEKEAIDNKIGCKWNPTENNKEKIDISKLNWTELTKEKLGYDVVNACQASKYLGKEMIVQGVIVDTYNSPKSNTVFLNFEKFYPNQCFTAVIFSSDLPNFVESPEDYYLNKGVRVFGKIKTYNGKPEVILEKPSQIEIGE